MFEALHMHSKKKEAKRKLNEMTLVVEKQEAKIKDESLVTQ